MKWAIRDLLNPVVTRSMLYGSDPFDIEYILKQVDQIKAMSGKKIQAVWLDKRCLVMAMIKNCKLQCFAVQRQQEE